MRAGDGHTWDAADWLQDKGEWSFTYDHLGNLLAADKATGLSIAYLVDPLGRRIGRTSNDAAQPDRGWLYQDQLNPVAELDEDGYVTSRFVYATRGHVPDFTGQKLDPLALVRSFARASAVIVAP